MQHFAQMQVNVLVKPLARDVWTPAINAMTVEDAVIVVCQMEATEWINLLTR